MTMTEKDRILQDQLPKESDLFLPHFIAGFFLCGFGVFFVALQCVRMKEIIRQQAGHESNLDMIRLYLERHVPERNLVVLRRTSIVIVASTIFGLAYEGLGARFLHHDLHPEYTVFHYTTHLTLTTLYLFVGWTTYLESMQRLPPDSHRVSAILALLGEVFLWHKHASLKSNVVDTDLHNGLALSSAMTACIIGVSVSIGRGETPLTTFYPFVSNLAGFAGFIHQGLWFFVISWHQKSPIAEAEYVTAYFCLLTIVVALMLQSVMLLFSPTKGKVAEGESLPLRSSEEDNS